MREGVGWDWKPSRPRPCYPAELGACGCLAEPKDMVEWHSRGYTQESQKKRGQTGYTSVSCEVGARREEQNPIPGNPSVGRPWGLGSSPLSAMETCLHRLARSAQVQLWFRTHTAMDSEEGTGKPVGGPMTLSYSEEQMQSYFFRQKAVISLKIPVKIKIDL